MKARFTDEAKTQLRAIHAYLAAEAPPHADAIVDRIIQRAEDVGDFPWSGRTVPEYPLDTLREVFMSPYRILYRVKPTEIEIISVVHYRQLLPGDL